ncbi:hypothetical protein Bca101_051624 [Brassica carinata]
MTCEALMLSKFRSFCFISQGGSSVMVNALDLQSFILRARVLKLYRQALKIAHRAPPQARGELKQSIRQEM